MSSRSSRILWLGLVLAILFSASFVIDSHSANGGYINLEQSTFANLTRAAGLSWTGNGFIASDRANQSAAGLVSISADGKNVTSYIPSFTTASGSMEDYIVISDGRAGFPSSYYYVLSEDSVYAINPENNSVKLFSTPQKGQQMSFINFDTVGTWDYQLLSLYQNGAIYSIDSNGSAVEIANVGPGQNPENVMVAPLTFGSFGGDVIVSEEIGNHSVLAISPTNRMAETVLARFPTEAPERVMVLQGNSDLYIGQYDKGTITKFPASDFANYTSTPSLLVITEGESGQNGSMHLLTAYGSKVTVTTIYLENNPHFEAAVFVPVNSTTNSSASTTSRPTTTSTTFVTTTSQSTSQNSGSQLLLAGVAIVIVAIAAGIAAYGFRKK